LLAYATEWSSETAAADYLEQYKSILRSKAKQTTFSMESKDRIEGANEYGRFALWRDGAKVKTIEGRE
jgi:hypothetical protein